MTEPLIWTSPEDSAVVSGKTQADSQALWHGQELESIREPVMLTSVSDDASIGDNPHTGLAHPKCLSERAFETLQPMLSNCGEIKRADLDGEAFYLFYPLIVLDCIDETRSEIKVRASGYRRLIQPVFGSCAAEWPAVFRARGFENQCVFVNATTQHAIKNAGLVGVELRGGQLDGFTQLTS